MKKLLFILILFLATPLLSQNNIDHCLITTYKDDTLKLSEIKDQFFYLYLTTDKISESDIKILLNEGWIISSKTKEIYKLLMFDKGIIIGASNVFKYNIYENK